MVSILSSLLKVSFADHHGYPLLILLGSGL
uniref:Uncharacterized protein n=1 Tax=Rhizophora mucronata TaxID=61149 RepID=A0A2P2QUA9_RHIMU